ncbi:2-succinyl-5-enolpyruvyl-6-hydroxy-3-cyclohexene-1-carboxylic-acid synthase [Virgibacillus sp. SK37]|uniref:2-succinyl-5-enolpyruvyl-6-hydroxy-3- cyclohexene-1-carboxylic-acid synthase n=1 Tax=Virgibacillus sp. SK37 TaxID=403957 RepID=UPI0004D1632B|nr:2-succinyl-5-enolpyruvyl-6-hydroxy-3-cyclohexene-1-carboxylic-acid synthase [Virgibacillus sp. SK37]AIF43999.1 2-succinyl-5-enolpyruvyl-6-hydroxy-3-cyclohexene-1-carboxylate synthase [Virgibacillus sp. SK37]
MDHIETLTRYTANFIDELSKNGVTDAVISPGSRSTPLAYMLAEHKMIKEWVILDERSAAFFALGLAKKTKRPVVIVCTSGTAAANYFPAIVEAYYSRVPLIVLTADRPHELRDVGAPQAIEQMKLYGDYVKWFHEMALPEASPKMLYYARSKAARASHIANQGNAGPVHLNFPFREPLLPNLSIDDLWGNQYTQSTAPMMEGSKLIDESQVSQLLKKLQGRERGMIVCGPQTEERLAEAITELAAAWKIPVLADPLSQIRAGTHNKDMVIEGYDAFLRNEEIREQLKPDFIIRFGAMPVSKAYLFYVQQHADTLQIVVDNNIGFREPAGNQTEFVFSDPVQFCEILTDRVDGSQKHEYWTTMWLDKNRIVKKQLTIGIEANITEGEAVRGLLDVIPNESVLYIGNSMAVRDLDTFFMTTSKKVSVLANRGANGIDGMISSAVGAAATNSPVTLVLGDLSFYHDMNGLLAAKHYNLNLTILLINNNGGGIFSFLPQASDKKHFEALFGTPVDIDFKQAILMYGGKYMQPATEEELKKALDESYQHQGLSVVETRTSREANMKWHQEKWAAIQQEILESEE